RAPPQKPPPPNPAPPEPRPPPPAHRKVLTPFDRFYSPRRGPRHRAAGRSGGEPLAQQGHRQRVGVRAVVFEERVVVRVDEERALARVDERRLGRGFRRAPTA